MSHFNRKPNSRQTPIERDMAPDHMRLTRATPEDATRVHHITQAASAEYRGVLDPPSGVDRETLADVERALDDGGAVLGWLGNIAIRAVRFQHAVDPLAVERVAVDPDHADPGAGGREGSGPGSRHIDAPADSGRPLAILP